MPEEKAASTTDLSSMIAEKIGDERSEDKVQSTHLLKGEESVGGASLDEITKLKVSSA